VSAIPCKITEAHFTWKTFSILLNLSSIKISASLPHIFLAIWFTDFIGLINIKHNGLNIDAKWHAGPDPIDLPHIKISDYFT
jgi:hypothetical protein